MKGFRVLYSVAIVTFLLPLIAWAGAEIGRVPPKVELKDKLGGRLDATPWSSEDLKGKVHAQFPDFLFA